MQTTIISNKAFTVSLGLWMSFALAMVWRWCGLTFGSMTACMLVSFPYVLLFLISRGSRFGNLKWLLLAVSFLVGSYGSFEYCRYILVQLSGMSNLVFTRVPIIQSLFLLIVFATGSLLLGKERS